MGFYLYMHTQEENEKLSFVVMVCFNFFVTSFEGQCKVIPYKNVWEVKIYFSKRKTG